MEEDVEAGPISDHGKINDYMKKEDIETEDVHTSESSNFSQPSHYQNFSRILSVNPLADSKDPLSLARTNSIQRNEDVDDGSLSVCICGEPSTKQILEDDSSALLQIECDICRVWYHAGCVGIGPVGILAIDKYHCPRCSVMCGPSILKPRTNTHRHDYTDVNAKGLVKQVGTPDFIEELRKRIMPEIGLNAAGENKNVSGKEKGDDLDGDEVITCLPDGRQLTLPFLNSSGFCRPIMIDICDPQGLGLDLPDSDFFSDDVPNVVEGGRERIIDVIDVHSQDTRRMPLGEFCDTFRTPADERDPSQCLNCLSLEVSDSVLGQHHLTPPRVARQLCWVNNVWPKAKSTDDDWSSDPPKVQKYCIMSMKNAFTDFHIDFGGTSVWYHIFKGEKIFYFIRPTVTNLSLYERWQRLSTQSEIFLGDMVDKCYRCVVKEGQTLFIPTGWIHAVLTTEDSLVFGGNFLHSLNIQLQLKAFEIEERIHTPRKFRFPSYEAVNWLAAQKLKNDLSDLNGEGILCPAHLLGGIRSLLQTLRTWVVQLPSKNHNLDKKENKKERDPCPNVISDPQKLVRDLNKEVRLAEKITIKCNPPKPARESTRMKRKKEDDDFIDISSRNALTFFSQPAAKKKKTNATGRAGRGKAKIVDDESSADDAMVVSKKYPFKKIKSTVQLNQTRQSKQNTKSRHKSNSSDTIEIPAKGKKQQDQSKGKSNAQSDTQKEKDKEMREKKSSSTSKEKIGNATKSKKAKNVQKKSISKVAVQNSESLDEDVDIITMHNNLKSKKKLKPSSPKKKLLINNADTNGKRQTKENGKGSAKSKVTKANKSKKIEPSNHTIEDESTSESTPKTKGNCVLIF